MKTAQDWVAENSQSGPFDLIGSIAEAIALVEAIQRDAKTATDRTTAAIRAGIQSDPPTPPFIPAP